MTIRKGQLYRREDGQHIRTSKSKHLTQPLHAHGVIETKPELQLTRMLQNSIGQLDCKPSLELVLHGVWPHADNADCVGEVLRARI